MKRFAITALLLIVFVVGYYALYINESSEWFTVNGEKIEIRYGYTWGGDVLNYAIARSWPADQPDLMRNDTRSTFGPIPIRITRNNFGFRFPVATNGRVYVYFGDQRRTMQVAMNEHSDTIGIANSQNMEDVWDFFSRYRVD